MGFIEARITRTRAATLALQPDLIQTGTHQQLEEALPKYKHHVDNLATDNDFNDIHRIPVYVSIVSS
ncbi:hypothetical protein PoB_005915000 [Plakobranchus ocellatus]|uniref:Uncharacterized protein n=1 Tax=Plakobranchus ocellatus TaxID=259542 RepID=A0AAV4CL37_9GAST|nr:hypothetical protein PoB_005915000 [Plakobranchus ocellatus]